MSHARTPDFISCVYLLVAERYMQNNSRNLATHQFHSLVENNKQLIVKHQLPTAKTNTNSLCRNSGRKSRRILDLLVACLTWLRNETLCWIWPIGKNRKFTFSLLKNRPVLLCEVWIVSNAPTACEICARVIHHSGTSKVVGNPCWDSIWMFHCACSILQPTGFDHTTYFSSTIKGSYNTERIQAKWFCMKSELVSCIPSCVLFVKHLLFVKYSLPQQIITTEQIKFGPYSNVVVFYCC